MNSAGFLLFILSACGSPQTPPANVTGSGDGGLLAALAPDASVPAVSDGDASTSDGGMTPINTATTTTDTSAPDPCNPASANFESQVRPKFNACYQEGKKKNPNLAGEIRITMSFDYKGKLTSTKVTGPDDLGKPVIACMLDAVKKTPFEFGEVCARKSIMVGKKFGEQKLTAPKGTITAD
ncbi:MAG: hypothetical protein ABI421_15210 [Polyangiaceae bacterium]